ncbi:FMN-linked oxidoreductase [Mollisia scopiformis]|uniref:FMN-linked oxidoreductase n=1 Tax=Mollisia scopiformis TaxID=149040 RepID=A0A132B548_MOLSC|nr:FMN-linked oxidoreductase [Mollisia scopiformis]KUJ07538.1 FMN-linked oxidoreductase [Mollisia scopiformis]
MPVYESDIQDEEDLNVRHASLDIHPLKLFDIAKAEGRPLYAAAPMVRYSKLAFRETVALYGVDLTWTPMVLAKEFNRSLLARDSGKHVVIIFFILSYFTSCLEALSFISSPLYTHHTSTVTLLDFTTSPHAPPTIVQFGCNSPLELSRATTLIAPHVNGIDLNCGCPQSWACSETLGAALMHKRELVASMVSSAKSALASLGYEGQKTVSVKIRVHKDLRDTIDFVKTVQDAGVDFITIHGRMRSTPSSKPVDLEAIKLVTEHVYVPKLANGDVFTLEDAREHVRATGVDGVMAARGLLENPGMIRGDVRCEWDVVESFMERVVRAPLPFKLVVHHLGEMGGSERSQRGKTLFSKEERAELMACEGMVDLIDWFEEMKERKARNGN